jgi:hypothetical protein
MAHHGFDVTIVADVVQADAAGILPHSDVENAAVRNLLLPDMRTCLQAHVVPALLDLFGSDARATELVTQITFAELSTG